MDDYIWQRMRIREGSHFPEPYLRYSGRDKVDRVELHSGDSVVDMDGKHAGAVIGFRQDEESWLVDIALNGDDRTTVRVPRADLEYPPV